MEEKKSKLKERISALEVHSGLSALLVEQSPKYNCLWVSSLTHSSVKGLPDNELVTLRERVDMVAELKKITTKHILVDVDTMGMIEHVPYYTKAFEDAGAYGIVIEDKQYPKQNSLLSDGKHELANVDAFCEKIRVAKENAKGMLVIARLESLIAKRSMEEALIRANAYINAGVDVILIHSKEKIGDEVLEFAKRLREISDIPMAAIPTTYPLPEDHPFDILIHANFMLRASMLAMQKVANAEDPKSIDMTSVEEIFNVLGH